MRREQFQGSGVAAIVYFLVPETKGRSLEDIQRLWIKRSGEADRR